MIEVAQPPSERMRIGEPLHDIFAGKRRVWPERDFLPSHTQQQRVEEHFPGGMASDNRQRVIAFKQVGAASDALPPSHDGVWLAALVQLDSVEYLLNLFRLQFFWHGGGGGGGGTRHDVLNLFCISDRIKDDGWNHGND